ncbi:MAG: hypothetical protein IT343_07470 [Candidatus Melainabacteria bacterium]|jgi:hypothetical protein|nr:hypothetical protein [Candidatus Melainabacteria bacterium]
MSEQVQRNLKVSDHGAEKTIQITPEAVKDGGVIATQPDQEVHGQAFANAHRDDKTLSEPDMIAMNDGETVAEYEARVAQIQANRFGFFDSAEVKTNDAGAGDAGKTEIHEHPAKQAVEPIPDLSPTVQRPPFESHVKINVQITNVPEVSEAVTEEVLGKYAEAVLENAVAAVRQFENHLAQPNAINSDLQKVGQWLSDTPGHFAQSPEQLNKDVQGIAGTAIDEIDKPLMPEDRAKMAGMLLPMFFFEGGSEPINPETIEQMGLEGMSEAELKALGVEKRVEVLEEGIIEKRRLLEEKDIVNPIDRSATASQKVAQLMALTKDNKPLVEKFLNNIDTKFGTNSEVGFKHAKDIFEKAQRPSIKEAKEWFDVEHIRDSFRFKTPVENLNDLPKLVERLKESGFEIVKVDLDKLLNPKARGWRVAAIDLKAPNGQLIEWQILPTEMNEAGHIEHQMYKNIRKKDVKTLTRQEKAEVREINDRARTLYSDAWYTYLRRTGQTKESIQRLIKDTLGSLE